MKIFVPPISFYCRLSAPTSIYDVYQRLNDHYVAKMICHACADGRREVIDLEIAVFFLEFASFWIEEVTLVFPDRNYIGHEFPCQNTSGSDIKPERTLNSN